MLLLLSLLENEDEKSRFIELYEEYRSLMYFTSFKILNNEKDAEDAVHEAFLRVIKHFEKISEIKCPKTRAYLVTIVENISIDMYRVKKNKESVPFDEEWVNVPSTDMISEYHSGNVIADAIVSLPAKYREVLLLKYDMGYKDEEIAELTAMTVSNVRKTVQRAKGKLEMILEESEASI
jgi:RNA polymerase sigma-70 factor (ECF subfamily)